MMRRLLFAVVAALIVMTASQSFAAGYPWSSNDLLSSADLNSAIKGAKAYNVIYATDSSADLTNLNAAIATSDVTPVYLMPGHYQVCSPLNRPPTRGKIYGSEPNSEFFLGAAYFPATYLYCPNAGTFTAGQAFLYGNFLVHFEGFAILGLRWTTADTGDVDCLNIGNTQYMDIRLFQAGYCRYGINADSDGSAGIAGQSYPQGVNTQGFRISHSHIFQNTIGFHAAHTNGGFVSDAILGPMFRTEQGGIYLDNSVASIQIIGTRLEDAWGTGDTDSTGLYCDGCFNLVVIGNILDRNHYANIVLKAANNVTITGNTITAPGWTETGSSVRFIGSSTNITIAGNTIVTLESPAQYAWRADSGATVSGIIADKVLGTPAGSNIYFDTYTANVVSPLLVATASTVPQSAGNVTGSNSLGSWTTTDATLTSATSTPWGTASHLVEGVTFTWHRVLQSATTYAGDVNYTFSAMFQSTGPAQRDLHLFTSDAAFANSAEAYFDSASCQPITAAASVGTFVLQGPAQAVKMGGGWCLAYITYSPGASYSGAYNIVEMTTGQSNNYPGDGSSGMLFYPIAVAQLKIGNAP